MELNNGAGPPGASDIRTTTTAVGGTTTRQTSQAPTSGKRARITFVTINGVVLADMGGEVYFGTGATMATTIANAILACSKQAGTGDAGYIAFPRGAGPIGDIDEVISVRNTTADAAGLRYTIGFTEE